jgi:hypothetical protein
MIMLGRYHAQGTSDLGSWSLTLSHSKGETKKRPRSFCRLRRQTALLLYDRYGKSPTESLARTCQRQSTAA